ncbi:hypothetical protein BD779DRAFT_1572541 [Infundibulicybe gibba]|nr:hypothetical protein BD779DRAFT_1572541 [Infundibulicybe gibba]
MHRHSKNRCRLHGATPFQVDRRVLKDVVREKASTEVGRIQFLSAGHLWARVARRFMPRRKTESEVATMQYLRENTDIPVPTVYHYDSNPYNRLGGEFILMSKASGIPLAQVFHSLPYNDLVQLLKNLAALVIPLFSHRFSAIGSLYIGHDPNTRVLTSTAPTPKATQPQHFSFPFSPASVSTPTAESLHILNSASRVAPSDFHVGPIISWPFFGSNRGELSHPSEINRGPWSSTHAYFASCAEREINGVISENEGRSAPHRLHLDPDEILSSRHHHLKSVPGDESDESDEWDLEESEEEWEGPGDAMYRDYRRMQRSTFLVAHMSQREESVRKEMNRWVSLMERLVQATAATVPGGVEEFGLDCHDLSLENVFVDAHDHTKITCIIDWESTTTRPLWACAHVPAFLQSSPFTAKIFLDAVAKLGTSESSAPTPKHGRAIDLASVAREWLYYESAGTRLRMAHRFAEWDGWEEGLGESLLGPEELEEGWFAAPEEECEARSPSIPESSDTDESTGGVVDVAHIVRRKVSTKLPFAKEKEKEQMLNTTGDICGGRGGELGRRLEAWLTVSGESIADRGKWHGVEDGHEVEVAP